MKGKLPRYLGLDEHLALGVNIAWYPGFTHHVMWAALWDFMQDFQKRGIAAWEDFVGEPQGPPVSASRTPGPDGEGLEKQRELEERYFSPRRSRNIASRPTARRFDLPAASRPPPCPSRDSRVV